MNISWMTLRDLEYLVAVERHMHFGNAAEACHVSQPALSTQVRKIEGMLGFAVFERTNRRVAVTDRGRLVVKQARVVLEEAQKIAAVGEEGGSRGEPRGPMSIGSIATLGPYYIPRVLPQLLKAFPNLQPILREGLTDELLAELRSGQLDVVLAARTFDETGFRVFVLFEEPFLLAVPRGHPLARKKKLRVSDLRPSDMVLLEDGHCLRDQSLELCPPNRRGNIRRYHATSVETLRHLVAAGLGYTLIPAMAEQPERQLKGLLKYRPLSESPGRTIVAACREGYARMPEAEKLAEFLRRLAPKPFSTKPIQS